jgi:methylenetetrahydrofolate dehydrogenase (NADP+)/methenyltetrahydrofolate cyclohydrolase
MRHPQKSDPIERSPWQASRDAQADDHCQLAAPRRRAAAEIHDRLGGPRDTRHDRRLAQGAPTACYPAAMTARILDPAALAASFRAEIRAEIASLPEPLRLVGFLGEGHAPSATYAEYTRRGCDDVGIAFELRAVGPDSVEREIRHAASADDVHGILVYYPVSTPERDGWLRELVDPRKDIEGLHSFWTRCLYENRRFVDRARTHKAILPCTPLAILKLLDAAGASQPGADRSLAGVRACVFNRSEVVGSPLAAMMANDGAEVVSFDVDGAQLLVPGEGRWGHDVRPTTRDRRAALAEADVIVTGVPSRTFPLVRADEIKPGAICLNFSTLKNFADDVTERAAVFVPRVGPMTVTMALRNTLRLYRNAHGSATT